MIIGARLRGNAVWFLKLILICFFHAHCETFVASMQLVLDDCANPSLWEHRETGQSTRGDSLYRDALLQYWFFSSVRTENMWLLKLQYPRCRQHASHSVCISWSDHVRVDKSLRPTDLPGYCATRVGGLIFVLCLGMGGMGCAHFVCPGRGKVYTNIHKPCRDSNIFAEFTPGYFACRWGFISTKMRGSRDTNMGFWRLCA